MASWNSTDCSELSEKSAPAAVQSRSSTRHRLALRKSAPEKSQFSNTQSVKLSHLILPGAMRQRVKRHWEMSSRSPSTSSSASRANARPSTLSRKSSARRARSVSSEPGRVSPRVGGAIFMPILFLFPSRCREAVLRFFSWGRVRWRPCHPLLPCAGGPRRAGGAGLARRFARSPRGIRPGGR